MQYYPTCFSNIFTHTIQMDPELKNYITVGCQWDGAHPLSDAEIDKFV